MEEFFMQIKCDSNSRYSVIIEDNGTVAYAYLMDEERIIGDVWLYNNAETPINAPWKEGKKMPFANPVTYLNMEKQISPLSDEDDVHVEWTLLHSDLTEVLINIRSQLVAKLRPGSKPGWSSGVVADGPLAKILK